jgi:hypothetical protein
LIGKKTNRGRAEGAEERVLDQKYSELSELCGHEKKFKNDENAKISLNRVLASADFRENRFFLMSCASAVK